MAIDQAWTENYGAGGVPDGPNLTFTVGGAGDVVTFSYDQVSHVLEISVVPAEPVDDAALVREPVRHPFVDEVLYFAIPDRSADGDRRNNCGDFEGVCVAATRRRTCSPTATCRATRATTTAATWRGCGASCPTSTASA